MTRGVPIPSRSGAAPRRSTHTHNINDIDGQPQPKFNGYIFKRDTSLYTEETRFIPKLCYALPLHPKTYGLSCNRPDCGHCHPETASEYRNRYTRPNTGWYRNRLRHYYGSDYYPAPGTCIEGRKGCRPEKMIYLRPKAIRRNKDDVRRNTTTRQDSVKGEDIKTNNHDSQRLSKWEASTAKVVDEGVDLAKASDVALPSDGWKADLWDAQIAFLVSQGLLDDYEAGLEDVDISMDVLRRDDPAYTVRYTGSRRRQRPRQEINLRTVLGIGESYEDWVSDLGTLSDDSMSWILLDE